MTQFYYFKFLFIIIIKEMSHQRFLIQVRRDGEITPSIVIFKKKVTLLFYFKIKTFFLLQIYFSSIFFLQKNKIQSPPPAAAILCRHHLPPLDFLQTTVKDFTIISMNSPEFGQQLPKISWNSNDHYRSLETSTIITGVSKSTSNYF